MTFQQSDLRRLLTLLDVTAVDEIDCHEFLHRIAGFLERLGPDGTPPAGYEDVVLHLKLCPECLEEFEALYRELRGEGEGG